MAAAVLTAVPATAQPGPKNVVTALVERITAPSTITLVGTVEAARRSRVGAEIAGLVANMPARQGDEIPAGGLLCELKEDTLQLRVAQAEARLAALKARHAELVAGTRREELARLQAKLDEAAAEFDRWDFEMKRVDQLTRDGRSNDKERADTKASFLAAKRRKLAAQADLDLGVNGPRAEVILQALHSVAEQQAVVDSARVDLARTKILAPFAGYVVDRTVEVGEWISVGDQVVELIELSSVLVRVHAPESAFPFIQAGGAARVSVDALQRTFEGRVRHIIRKADPNARTFPIEVEVDNPERVLAAGMFARVTLTGGPAESILAVPQDAIVERGGTPYVATVFPGRQGGLVAMLTPVTVGGDVGDMIAITSNNLTEGGQVITRGNEGIMPFPTPVLLVDENGTPVAPPQPTSSEHGKAGP